MNEPKAELEVEVARDSRVEVDYHGQRKAITDVIRIYKLAGDDVRMKLMESIRATVKAARQAREEARQYLEAQQED